MLTVLQRDHRVRFAVTGLAMTLLHLGIYRLVSPHTLPEVANATAFVLATQVNFLVSYHWTWRARRGGTRDPLRRIAHRALLFNASVLVAFGANSAAFWAVHRLLGVADLASVLVATVVSAGVSYLVSSRFVFARAAPVSAPAADAGAAAPVVLPAAAPVPAPAPVPAGPPLTGR